MMSLNTIENAFVGTCHVAGASVYSAQFVSYLMPKKESVHQALELKESSRNRVLNRIGAGFNVVGSFARLFDWIITKKWVIVREVHLIALKMIAHITGFFYYFKKALDSSGALLEIEKITGNFSGMITLSRHEKDSLEVRKFAEWSNLFSNIILAICSGIELAALITGAVIFSPVTLDLLLTAGFVSLVASTLFRFSSGLASGLIDHYRANSDQKYSYKY